MSGDTYIDYLRHGMPMGGRMYRGQIDDPLSELGFEQMRAAADAEGGWVQVISSPMQRCRAFADELGRAHGLPVRLDDRLMEVGFGEWEGMTGGQIDARWPDARSDFYQDPYKNRPLGAEPLMHFFARCVEAWDEISTRYLGERVLVVTHAGVIRATLAHVAGVPIERMYRFQVANASLTRIHLSEQRPPQILFHGRDVARVGQTA